MMPTKIALACIVAGILCGGLLLFTQGTSKHHSRPSIRSELAALTKNSLSLSGLPSGAFGKSLASLIHPKDLPILKGDIQRFPEDCREWLGAYTVETYGQMQSIMLAYGIAPPPSWSTPERAADSWSRNLALLEVVAFDALPPVVKMHANRQPDMQRNKGRVMRCGRRDDARPFLQNHSGEELEVVFSGQVWDNDANKPVPVQVAFTFAWNATHDRWVVTGTCLFDFPNSMSEAYALLL